MLRQAQHDNTGSFYHSEEQGDEDVIFFLDFRVTVKLGSQGWLLSHFHEYLCISQKIEESRCFDKLSMTILDHFTILRNKVTKT